VHNEILKLPLPPNIKTILSFGDTFIQGITPSSAEQKAIEEVTRRRAISKRWAEERYCRLTALNFGRVLMRRSNHSKLAHDILFTKLPSSVPSLQWGRKHEEDAFVKYCSLIDNSYTVRKAGFVIGSPAYLGASPDGIVEQENTPVKLIEIKCPFSVRHLSVKEACADKQFFCLLESDAIHLKDDHPYYHQVQGTMAMTGIHVTDFIVWTPISMEIEEIKFDSDLWNVSTLPKLQVFYKNHMLPAILY